MTQQEAVEIVMKLGAIYRQETSETDYAAWWEFLEPLDTGLAREAYREVAKAEHFFPSIARYLEAYREVQRRWLEENPPVGYDGRRLPQGTF